MGNGIANKIVISFDKHFWGSQTGWLGFVASQKENPYIIAYIVPHATQHILCIFSSANPNLKISKMTDS